jgi:hypothetical protein
MPATDLQLTLAHWLRIAQVLTRQLVVAKSIFLRLNIQQFFIKSALLDAKSSLSAH